MRKFLLFFLLLGSVIGSHAQVLEEPDVDMPSEACKGSLVEGVILNMPITIPSAFVFVKHNSEMGNCFIPPKFFQLNISSSIEDTVTIYFINGPDTTQTTKYISVLTPSNLYLYDTICATALPFTWEGQLFTSAGSKTISFLGAAANGCDSNVYLNLAVKPTTNHTTAMSVCSDELPIVWNGITVSSGGTSAATYTTLGANGCDSVTTLSLTVNPIKYTTVTETVCYNDLPYTWHGTTIYEGGTAVASYTTSSFAGCDSIITLNLNIAFSSSVIFSDTICEGDLPYLWNGFPIYTEGEGVASFMTTSHWGCDSLTTLNLYVLPTVYSSFTDTICEDELPYLWKGHTISSGGVGIDSFFTISTLYGCDSVVTLNLVIGTYDTVLVNQSICSSELPYLWNGITVSAGGTSVATYTTASHLNCDSVSILNLTVHPVIRDTTEMTICSGALPIVWNGITVSSGGVGVADVLGVSMYGCDSFSVLNVTVNPPYEVYDTQSVCTNEFPVYFGDSLEIVSAGSYTYPSTSGECDTMFYLYVTELLNASTEEFDSICLGSLPIVWNGIEVIDFGYHTAQIVYVGVNGCDSFQYLNLYPYDEVESPLVINAEEVLMVASPSETLTYQWQKWNESSTAWENILGATATTYIATSSGKYRVAATFSSCPEVYSNEVTVDVLTNGIQNNLLPDFQCFPNPTNNIIKIVGLEQPEQWEVNMYDYLGREYFKQSQITNSSMSIDMSNWSSGAYWLVVYKKLDKQIIQSTKIIKK